MAFSSLHVGLVKIPILHFTVIAFGGEQLLSDLVLKANVERLSMTSLLAYAHTACAFDIRLYLTPLGQPKQFIETCGT